MKGDFHEYTVSLQGFNFIKSLSSNITAFKTNGLLFFMIFWRLEEVRKKAAIYLGRHN